VSAPTFGITLPLSDVAAFARLAEDLEYDYVTSGEHITFHGPQANAFVTLGVAAGATRRVQLLSTVTLLAVYPAALAAKMAAMLDHLSNGRFNLGVGIGGEFPAEFEAAGIPVRQRASRTDEALQVVRRLLDGGSASFDGRYNSFRDITIEPQPIRRPLPIWIAGRKEPAMRRAARFGDAWLPYMYTPDQLVRSVESIERFTIEAGRAPGTVKPAVFSWAMAHPDGARARRVAADVVGETYRQDFSRLVDRYVIAGTPAECRDRIRQFVDAGATTVILNPACPPGDTADVARRFAEDVIPDVRRVPV